MTPRRLITAAVAGLSALALSACASLDQYLADSEERLETICAVAPGVHAAFLAAADSSSIDPDVVAAERDAYRVVVTVCDDPPEDTATALATVAEAYAVIRSARAGATEAGNG